MHEFGTYELDEAEAELIADKLVEKHGDDLLDQLADDDELADAVREQREEKQNNLGMSRRGLMATLGASGLSLLTGSALGADTSSGGSGAPGYSQDIYLDEIIRPDGSQVAGDLDNSGMFDWNIGHSMPALDTKELNHIQVETDRGNFTTSADLQSLLNSLPSQNSHQKNVVWCEPGGLYDSITIPQNTYLALNGAEIRPNSDGVAVDASAPRSRLIGPGRINVSQIGGFSGDAYLVSTATAGTTLRLFDDANVPQVIGGPVTIAGADSGTGVRFVADGDPISLGGVFNFQLRGLNDHLVFQTDNGGFINGLRINYQGRDYRRKAIRHINTTGSAGAARNMIYGEAQVEADGHFIHNETGAPSVRYQGQIWDPQQPTTAIEGPYVRVQTPNNVTASHVTFGTGTTINGTGQEALSGGTPTAGDYRAGDVVEDTDNPGTLHKLSVGGSWATI